MQKQAVFFLLQLCLWNIGLSQEEAVCRGEQKLQQENKWLKAENSKLTHQLEELNVKLEGEQNSVRQYTEKVAQQERQLSSLTISQEVARKEHLQIEELATKKIQKLQAELEAVKSQVECPIIPDWIVRPYNSTVQPYVTMVVEHPYSQKAAELYAVHVHPVVNPVVQRGMEISGQVSEKVMNDYVPVAMNYSSLAAQKSYDMGVVVLNSKEVQQAKEMALKTDQELQRFILSQMQSIEQVKHYADAQMALLIVYSMYSTIALMMMMICMLVCCRSKTQESKTSTEPKQAFTIPKSNKKNKNGTKKAVGKK
eukprot:TRINITY_DN1221_c0_g1_i1.p1 TRINITY_DN1221_c0_g1~~TRINITY_DN1221_c0_g1_i1.p1  ORF type:complete len:311 (+),score=37.22 TRINITY_DN1221_c0_g1_i1:122-1054(+)